MRKGNFEALFFKTTKKNYQKMSIVYLNENYLPMEDAKISPMDRGFLFGDGVYEVIPSYGGKMVGFIPHIERMKNSLNAIGLKLDWNVAEWREVCEQLISRNGSGNLGIYLHVSRGAEMRRFHAYPENVQPTVFGFTFEIAVPAGPDKKAVKPFRVVTALDLRWERCNIKSTALLGNVLHFQQGHERGCQEVLLYNSERQLTEASSCNVFIVKNGIVNTPPLDNHILPGITRYMLIDILRKYSSIPVKECIVTMQEVLDADEVWVTSSSKEIVPVIEIDGHPVGDGKAGELWLEAQKQYSAHKYEY